MQYRVLIINNFELTTGSLTVGMGRFITPNHSTLCPVISWKWYNYDMSWISYVRPTTIKCNDHAASKNCQLLAATAASPSVVIDQPEWFLGFGCRYFETNFRMAFIINSSDYLSKFGIIWRNLKVTPKMPRTCQIVSEHYYLISFCYSILTP